MKGKTLIIAGIATAVLIVCFVVYNTYSNTGIESKQIAVVFPMDEKVSIEMFDEAITDLYKEMAVKSEISEEESDIQEMAEAGEMVSDAENEETLSKAESAQNTSEAQKSDPDGTTELTGATQPSGDDTTTQPSGGETGPGGVDLDAIRAALGQTDGYSGPNSTSAGDHSGSNHGITMAQ